MINDACNYRPQTYALLTCDIDLRSPKLLPAVPLTMQRFLAFRDAIGFAQRAHRGQLRLDGRAFVSHPLAVLQLLLAASIDLPHAAYVAALLHDTAEDGTVSIADIRSSFGDDVADAVEALTRPAKSVGESAQDCEEAYLSQLVAANARLPFVLLIKMADRLHNLETAQFLPPQRREALMHETAIFYLPALLREEPRQTHYCDAYRALCGLLEECIAHRI